jgi:hypothetical protein
MQLCLGKVHYYFLWSLRSAGFVGWRKGQRAPSSHEPESSRRNCKAYVNLGYIYIHIYIYHVVSFYICYIILWTKRISCNIQRNFGHKWKISKNKISVEINETWSAAAWIVVILNLTESSMCCSALQATLVDDDNKQE